MQTVLFTIREASIWASGYLKKTVTPSNISYLVQYGLVQKFNDNGTTQVDKQELIKYYDSYFGKRSINWTDELGDDLNWTLSFEHVKEAETTKHVHRLHPYKGKFIPQLVEYFLDEHTDSFKNEVFFKPGDVICDPFCGSGTTLVQSCELGIHGIGIDISHFNTLISNVKVARYNLFALFEAIYYVTSELRYFVEGSPVIEFESKLIEELAKYNNDYFPVPNYKYKIKRKLIDGNQYGAMHEEAFLPIYSDLVKKYKIQLQQHNQESFLDRWYMPHIREEIDLLYRLIMTIKDSNIRNVLSVTLSRTIRSCRATTHADLATLKSPVTTTYYCAKHGKICKPLFSMLSWWERYSKNTMKRLAQFDKLRTNTQHLCLTGDARNLDILGSLKINSAQLYNIVTKNGIKGVFTSPPYIGLIDYHEQHAYSYDLFGFERRDDFEIGPKFRGRGREARDFYVQGISEVLINCRRFLVDDFDLFLVANDKFNLYPIIAESSDMMIVNRYNRPVLNRTEKDRTAYSENIFHLKRKQ